MASPNIGGYNLKFLDPPAKLMRLKCPICLLVTREPNLTSCCGYHFCQSCINRIFADRKPCPLCKEVNFTVLLDKGRRRKVLELNVQCSLTVHGCDWSGGLRELAKHLDTHCQFVNLTCPNSCGETCQRRHMSYHHSFKCRKRPFTCNHCEFKATYELVCQHYNECEKFPLKCPNKCEVQSVERAKMVEHLSKCPLQLVNCEYAHAGCSERIQRKDIVMHMEQNVQKDLLCAFTASQRQIQHMEKKFEELQRENAALKQQVWEQNTQLQRENAALKQQVREQNTQLQRENAALKQQVREQNTQLQRENAALKQQVREQNTQLQRENAALKQQVREQNTQLQRENAALKQQVREQNTQILRMNATLKQQNKELQDKVLALERHTGLRAPMEFTVDKYSHLKENSPAFFLWPRGPKVCLSIKFSSTIQLELHILPGEFDREITWPMWSVVSFYVFDHRRGHGYLLSSDPSEFSKATQQRCVARTQLDYTTVENQSQEAVQFVKNGHFKFMVEVDFQ